MNRLIICQMLVLALTFAAPNRQAAVVEAVPAHATEAGRNIIRLLETYDVEAFANRMALTNAVDRKRVSNSARGVLEHAARLGLTPGRVKFHLQEVRPKKIRQLPDSQNPGQKLSWTPGILIVLRGEPTTNAPGDTNRSGEYALALGGSRDYSDGWRTYDGIRWDRFPEGVADERLRVELPIIALLAEQNSSSLHAANDPALIALGQVILRFLQQRDATVYGREALPSFAETWAAMEKKMADAPSQEQIEKNEFENDWNANRESLMESARQVLANAEALGVDFTGAELKLQDVIAEQPGMRGVYGSIEGIESKLLRFIFQVKSERKSKAGRDISGEYILAATRGKRSAERWTLDGKMHWQQYPPDLLGPEDRARLEFENYVAEHGRLPSGMAAPNITLTRLDNEATVKLADYKGKIVVLEWWATWCGPCQSTMADLQKLSAAHPEWKDKVQVITLSIDDHADEAKAHLAKKGWTNALNTWAGPGGWQSEPSKQFRVRDVPICYILNPEGRIAWAGMPFFDRVPEVVGGLLEPILP
jgi:thiol-disulfide isomerase/thioredoxin